MAPPEGELSLLVGDVLVRHPDLAGLDAAAELFAVDLPDTDAERPAWGRFWSEPLRGAPPLPHAVRAWLPGEGGFVLRPMAAPGVPCPAAESLATLVPDPSRRVLAPPRAAHRDAGFPEPRLISNDVFSEVRYAMAPSLLQWFDFVDIHQGILRILALPDFEGEVRLLTLVDEEAARTVLAEAELGGLQRKRLNQFLHAAAAAPPSARWPTTADLVPRRLGTAGAADVEEGSLYPHQEATVSWMRSVEAQGATTVAVPPVAFAGVVLGTAYDVALPCGGVVAHPPGSGKTRIVATLAASTAPGLQEGPLADTLVVCPAHLCGQWARELELAGAPGVSAVVDYDASGSWGGPRLEGWRRVVIDEPQDCPSGETWDSLQTLTAGARAAGCAVWLLCGTARPHLETIGRLLLGRTGWLRASMQSEWRGVPQLPHLLRSRFVADPAWACLPMPPLEVSSMPVTLRPQESADAAVASMAGFVLDSVLLVSFGAELAARAAAEREQLLVQMGWLGSVGGALLPASEHSLADWEGVVAQRSQEKLQDLLAQIEALEAEEGRHASRFQLADGDAALAPDLAFMAGEVVKVTIEGLDDGGPVAAEACPAEWNDLLLPGEVSGPLLPPGAGGGPIGPHVALLLSPADGDFAGAAEEAGRSGAVAAVFEAPRERPHPFGYRHDQAPPRLPAAMVGAALASRARAASEGGRALLARVRVERAAADEDVEDDEGGLVSAFIAEDAVDNELHSRLKGLRDERDRCERALRFARHMRLLLEQSEARCPICLQAGAEAEVFAVMPDCFHVLCRACITKQCGLEPSFACPMCRVSVVRRDVAFFRAPAAPPPAEERPGLVGATLPLAAQEALPGGGGGGAPRPGCGEQALRPHISTSGGAWEALPSKLQALLALLGGLLASGPEERVLVFTQWAVHVAHLGEVLLRHGVPVLSLCGELRETMDALSRFGQPGEPRVLLLSSQRHSSGINLQAARHVVIVHPYCTPTASSRESISRAQMFAFEVQAIGRVRRFPQRRPVHVYRFFAVGTAEEELYIGR